VKASGLLFAGGSAFYAFVAVVYWFITGEIVGTTALALTAGLAGLIGFYTLFTIRRIGYRPEDSNEALISEADPDYGFFSPHSWWPLVVGLGAMATAIGFAFTTWWLIAAGFITIMLGAIGTVFEYQGGVYVDDAPSVGH